VERRILGVSAAEIRYTFEDVRQEIRATRTELKAELAEVRQAVERLEASMGHHAEPAAERSGGDRPRTPSPREAVPRSPSPREAVPRSPSPRGAGSGPIIDRAP
jgi:hypothetical protein